MKLWLVSSMSDIKHVWTVAVQPKMDAHACLGWGLGSGWGGGRGGCGQERRQELMVSWKEMFWHEEFCFPYNGQ